MEILWEELHLLLSKELLVEVEHVKAHRTKKEKKEMSHFEKFVTEGNEKADELAKKKKQSMLDEGFYSGSKSKDSPAGPRRGVCRLAVRSQLSLFGGRMEGL